MGISATVCIAIGSFPQYLYALLPYPVHYEPYTLTHIVLQLQLLFFSALAFAVLKLTRIYPPELPSTNIDVDWTYRKLLPGAGRLFIRLGAPLRDAFFAQAKGRVAAFLELVHQYHGPQGIFARTWLTSSSTLVVLVFLALYLAFYL
jgi:multicomponent Na+:H+ antiporter subunit D